MSDPLLRDRVLVGSALAVLAAGSALGPAAPLAVAAAIAIASVMIALAALLLGAPATKPTALLCASLLVLFPTGLLWQPLMAVALGLLAIAAWRRPNLRVKIGRGNVPWLATLATAAVTPLALAIWVAWLHPDLRDVAQRYVPSLPLGLLVFGGLLFVVSNAALEELIWRGVFQDGLERVWGSGMAIAIQSISFGILHAHGVPRGISGVILAGVWAAMLGMLRHRAGGLLAPFLAHTVADGAIAVIVFAMYR